MQCRLNQEKYLRKYSVKKHKEKPDRVYLAYKKVDNNRIEKEKRKVANDYLTQTIGKNKLKFWVGYTSIILMNQKINLLMQKNSINSMMFHL